MSALSHCPFCKSRCVTGWTETDSNGVTTDAWIECDDCFARGPQADTDEEAAVKWNAATDASPDRTDTRPDREGK